MQDLGPLQNYIGINVNYDVNSKIMRLNQTNYIESLAEKHRCKNSRSYKTPMENNLKLEQAEHIDQNIKYRNIIGALLYISMGTRPGIAFKNATTKPTINMH